MKKQIILSTLTAVMIFLGGCGESNTTDINTNIETPQAPVNPYKTAGWYGKTQVSATDTNGKVYKHSTAGVFGELVQSKNDQDQHDIPGYGATTFQVILLPDFSTDTTVGYFSDYREYDEHSAEKQVWTFQVKNQQTVDLSNAPIHISLDGIHDVKYKDDNGSITYKESQETNQTILNDLHLVDVDNQTEYTVTQLQTANLAMDRQHTRTFRWVLGSVDSSDYEALPSPQRAAGRSAIASDFKAPTQQKNGGKFGLPPQ